MFCIQKFKSWFCDKYFFLNRAILLWPRELKGSATCKKPPQKNKNKLRKHLHQFDNTRTDKFSQLTQIQNVTGIPTSDELGCFLFGVCSIQTPSNHRSRMLKPTNKTLRPLTTPQTLNRKQLVHHFFWGSLTDFRCTIWSMFLCICMCCESLRTCVL